jgi:hypothetical protein
MTEDTAAQVDMSEGYDLGVDVAAIELDPLFEEGRIKVEVLKAAVEPNKEKNGFKLALTLKTVEPGKSTAGKVINPGVLINDSVGLTPSPKYTQEDIAKKVKRLGACFGYEITGTKFKAQDLIGLQGVITVHVEEDKTGKYDPRNRPKRYLAD